MISGPCVCTGGDPGGTARRRPAAVSPAPATETFCANHGLTHMMRGHSVKAEGLGLQARGAVITIFSDSMDHNVRGRCGWVLVERREGMQQKMHLHVGGPQH